MRNKNDLIKFGIGFVISLLCTCFGVLFAPILFDMAIERNDFQLVQLILGIGILILTFFWLIVLLVQRGQSTQCTLKQAIIKTFRLAGLYLMCWIVISLVLGLISTLLYAVLKNIIEFEQIKGIINLITAIIFFLGLPSYITIFWTVVKDNGKGCESFKNGLRMPINIYLKLMAVVMVLYGTGMLITTLFNFLPYTITFKILKIVMLSLVGGLGFVITNTICQCNAGGKM